MAAARGLSSHPAASAFPLGVLTAGALPPAPDASPLPDPQTCSAHINFMRDPPIIMLPLGHGGQDTELGGPPLTPSCMREAVHAPRTRQDEVAGLGGPAPDLAALLRPSLASAACISAATFSCVACAATSAPRQRHMNKLSTTHHVQFDAHESPSATPFDAAPDWSFSQPGWGSSPGQRSRRHAACFSTKSDGL